MAQLVPGRTDVQCRERFMNVHNPGMEGARKACMLVLAAALPSQQARHWTSQLASQPAPRVPFCAGGWVVLANPRAPQPGKAGGGEWWGQC